MSVRELVAREAAESAFLAGRPAACITYGDQETGFGELNMQMMWLMDAQQTWQMLTF